MLRQLVQDLVPGCLGPDEGVELWSDSGITVQASEPDGHFWSFRPGAPEQARAAGLAERLDAALTVGTESPNVVCARHEPEVRALDAPLGTDGRARVATATRAVTVSSPQERTANLEPDRTAKTSTRDEHLISR